MRARAQTTSTIDGVRRAASQPPRSGVQPAPGVAAPEFGKHRRRSEWQSLGREVDRLNLADPRAALALAERWAAAESGGEGRAWAIRALAFALRFNGQHERADERFGEAEQAFVELALEDEVARARLGHVEALRYLGRYEQAIELARNNLAYLESRGPALQVEAAKQTTNLGLVYWRLGHLRRALACFRRVQRVAREQRDGELAATASMNVSLVLADLGRYGEALRAGRYAARQFRRLGLRERLATVQMNSGLLYARRAEYARALEALEVSRALCEELGLAQKRSAVDLVLARTYLALNLDVEAAEACERAVETLRNLGLPFELAHALTRSAQAAERLGNLEEARALIGEARQVFACIGNSVWEAVSTVQTSRLALAARDGDGLERALDASRAAAERLDKLGALDHAAAARLVIGDLHARLGQAPAAMASYEAAGAIGERTGADGVLHLARAAQGALLEASAPDEALASFRRAVEHLERLRARARADDLKMAIMAGKVDLYERIAALLLRADGAESSRGAFGWLERGRSRGLLEQALAWSSRERARSGPGLARLRERIGDLRAALNGIYSERYALDRPAAASSGADDRERARRLETDLAKATRELQILMRRDDGPPRSESFDAERVQAALAPGSCLLEYALLGEELVCFVVRRESFALHRGLASRRELVEASEWFWFHIRKGTYGADFLRARARALGPAVDRILGRLGELLLAPLAGSRGADRVLVVPHGLLHNLPFHAFRLGSGALLDYATVSYAPSAAVFVALRERGQPRPSRPLMVGPDLPDLPWVDEELKRVARVFPDAVALGGRRATAGALRRHAPRCDALHLATHGVFRADNPSFSALELADGWLTVGQLAELCHGFSLVTLSACHSAVNGLGPGDELLGLTRAVLGAGSAALVASLWAANDETTPALMAAFYAGLQGGHDRASSLREAALSIRASEPHPYFWAPFILVGAS
ncbi:MAG TPA: CHAT domain-containing protein [Chloroflexota bacterium]|nr:CHAT domain-containing protein [Chloroflexota bacterium]